ncbi:MAG: PEP-CTERM sorting domain-containing protein [Phycisphaeraceae bacterium]
MTGYAKKTTLSLVAALLAAGGAHGQYDLTYNAADGSLTIDTMGGTIINYVLELETPLFLETPVASDRLNHTPILGGFATSLPNILSESDPFNPVSGVLPLGTVLPTGLTEAEYLGLVFVEDLYVAGLGTPRTSFNRVYVPEPTSLAILGLGGLLVTRRRRAA